jgi:surface antigen
MRGQSSSRLTLIPALILAVSVAIAPVLAVASNLSFLKNSVVSKFNDQDMKLLMDTVDKALDSTDPHASGNWSNPKTGNSGEVAVTRQFTSTDGHTCKNVNVVSRTPNMQGKADYILCAMPGRGWLLNPEARPAQADAAASPKQK